MIATDMLHRTNNCKHKDNIFVPNLIVLCIQNKKYVKTRFTVELKNVLRNIPWHHAWSYLCVCFKLHICALSQKLTKQIGLQQRLRVNLFCCLTQIFNCQRTNFLHLSIIFLKTNIIKFCKHNSINIFVFPMACTFLLQINIIFLLKQLLHSHKPVATWKLHSWTADKKITSCLFILKNSLDHLYSLYR